MHIYDEYKRLLVLQSAIDNCEGVAIPMNIIKDCIKPLDKFIERRVIEIEKERE